MLDAALSATVVEALCVARRAGDVRVTRGGLFVDRQDGRLAGRRVRFIGGRSQDDSDSPETRSVAESRRFIAEKLEGYLRASGGQRARRAQNAAAGGRPAGEASPKASRQSAAELRELMQYRRRYDAVMNSLRALKEPAGGAAPLSGRELNRLARRVVKVAQLGRLPQAPAKGGAAAGAPAGALAWDDNRRQFHLKKSSRLASSWMRLATHFRAGRNYYARRAAASFAAATRSGGIDAESAWRAFLASGHRLEDVIVGGAGESFGGRLAEFVVRADPAGESRQLRQAEQSLLAAFKPGGDQWPALLAAAGGDPKTHAGNADLLGRYLEQELQYDPALSDSGVQASRWLARAGEFASALSQDGVRADELRSLYQQCDRLAADIASAAARGDLAGINQTLDSLEECRGRLAALDPIHGGEQIGADQRRALRDMSLAGLRRLAPRLAHPAALALQGEFGAGWAFALGALDADVSRKTREILAGGGDGEQIVQRSSERSAMLQERRELLFGAEKALCASASREYAISSRPEQLTDVYESGDRARRTIKKDLKKDPKKDQTLSVGALASLAEDYAGLAADQAEASLNALGGLWSA